MTGQVRPSRQFGVGYVLIDMENTMCGFVDLRNRHKKISEWLNRWVYNHLIVVDRPMAFTPINWSEYPNKANTPALLRRVDVVCDKPNAVDLAMCAEIIRIAEGIPEGGFSGGRKPSLVILSGDGMFIGPIKATRHKWEQVIVISHDGQTHGGYESPNELNNILIRIPLET